MKFTNKSEVMMDQSFSVESKFSEKKRLKFWNRPQILTVKTKDVNFLESGNFTFCYFPKTQKYAGDQLGHIWRCWWRWPESLRGCSPSSLKDQPHPGLYQHECGQQVMGSNYSPIFVTGETTSGHCLQFLAPQYEEDTDVLEYVQQRPLRWSGLGEHNVWGCGKWVCSARRKREEGLVTICGHHTGGDREDKDAFSQRCAMKGQNVMDASFDIKP